MITRDGIQGLAAFTPAEPAKTAAPKAEAKAVDKAKFDKAMEQAKANPASTVRPDYKSKLEEALKSLVGPQTPTTPAKVDPVIAPLVKPDKAGSATKTIDLDKLPPETGAELKRLQTAAEGFEANFIKDWFSKMRQTSMDSDKSATGGMAKDFMDQALADSAAKGSTNLGIGKVVFAETGKRVVQETIARLHKQTEETA
ncbi:MAG: hypothetical protein JSS65_04630 [Armatimonadetes bacterium]|nr:hypothetical protein [Armatimonadota bacterium]